MALNELEPSMAGVIAPTDSRLRPDIRAMETGDIGMENSLACSDTNLQAILLLSIKFLDMPINTFS